MKKIKAIAAALVFAAFSGQSVFASGYPVLDIANLMNAIEQLYSYYQQVQNTIEQVQNTYTQIEQAATQMASLNWDDLKNLGDNFKNVGENPFEVITGVRNSAQDITKAVNAQMNKVNNLTDSLTKKSISFGGKDFSVADLCGAGDPKKNLLGFAENAWSHTVSTYEDTIAGYVGKLDYKDKQKIMRQYGMSPRNYATLELANYQLSELVKTSNIEATIEGQQQLLEEYENGANALNTLVKEVDPGNEFGMMQMMGSGLADIERLMGRLHKSLVSGVGTVSNYIFSKKTEEAVKQQQKYEDQKKIEEAVTASPVYDDGL